MLRSCCQNALAIGVAFMGDQLNHRRVRFVCVATEPLEKWDSSMSTTLRVVYGRRVWVVEQLEGGFMLHVWGILDILSNAAKFEYCGFILPGRKARDADDANDNEIMCAADDEMAHHSGSMLI